MQPGLLKKSVVHPGTSDGLGVVAIVTRVVRKTLFISPSKGKMICSAVQVKQPPKVLLKDSGGARLQ